MNQSSFYLCYPVRDERWGEAGAGKNGSREVLSSKWRRRISGTIRTTITTTATFCKRTQHIATNKASLSES
jgi:hypothetical protein